MVVVDLAIVVVDVDVLVEAVVTDVLVEVLGDVVVEVDVEADVLGDAVVVDVGAQSESSWRSSAEPCGLPLKAHWSLAWTTCVPGPIEISMTSTADGPSNTKSRCATSVPSTRTDSCDVAVTGGKSRYTNSTRVHEMLIVLECAEATVENNINPNALRSRELLSAMIAIASARCLRRARSRMCCS